MFMTRWVNCPFRRCKNGSSFICARFMDFTEEERSNARNVLRNSMAAEIAAQADQSPKGELPGRETTHAADRRKGAIRVAPIAGRRTSILALTATLGLVVIVTGGTLEYRW